ncbi:MAG: glycine cleavage T C-terminal barrel domain-containing protein [Candidatus Zeuxoniibacter abyssi]|nr:MAG: glycine cleavage T C-terminal barrel domain-containing protein [Candidatus Persebacteraceae bacterium AB1(2)]
MRRLTWGLRCPRGIPCLGKTVFQNAIAGVICSSVWSPYQQCGVAIVRLNNPRLGPGTKLEVECTNDKTRPAEVCDTPMYDKSKEIPRQAN